MSSFRKLFPISEFEKHSQQREPEVLEFFRMILNDHDLHSKFLNTISYLEYLGSQKIMLSQGEVNLSRSVLEHLAEETRHAYFFKRAAERVRGTRMEYRPDELLVPASARMYFRKLDAFVSKVCFDRMSPSQLPYHYVTAGVEIRAEWLYQLYESVLRDGSVGITLKSVLIEEQGHLREMYETLKRRDAYFEQRMSAIVRFEMTIFDRFWDSLVSEVVKIEDESGEDMRGAQILST